MTNTHRLRRIFVVVLVLTAGLAAAISYEPPKNSLPNIDQTSVLPSQSGKLAVDLLGELEVRGRAPKTGYSRAQFGNGWGKITGCDVRNIILNRDLRDVQLDRQACLVLSGILDDPYTGNEINFNRAEDSGVIQIDHVVALSDAWQKGAQNISYDSRVELANDPLNLLAVDGPANQQKGDADAASWLPPNKSFRCQYIARQIAVKYKYNLWVTGAEKGAIESTLVKCPGQLLPN